MTPAALVSLARVAGGELTAKLQALAAPGTRVATLIADPALRARAVIEVAAADMTLVPMSTRWPDTRRQRVLEIAKAGLLVSDVDDELRVDLIDGDVPTAPDPALYVLFTSGSTGAPKGVRMSVAAAHHHFRATISWLRLTPDDVVMQFADLCFDTSQEEIWPTLMAGARLVPAPANPPGFGALAKAINEHRVTVLQLPTAYWRSWTQAIERRDLTLSTLRLLVVGGEAAYVQDARRWRAGPLGHVRLINAYGPTEAGISATAYEVPFVVRDEDGPLPIGTALPGRQLNVDSDGQLVISGPCLFDGYETATAASDVIPSYPTGDRVTWDDERQVYLFDGRVDRETKVRGARVHLDHVESELLAAGGVREAKVLVCEDGTANRVLAACLAVHAEVTDRTMLRNLLAERMVEAMVPTFLVLLDRLPTNSSGKIDGVACGNLITAEYPQLTVRATTQQGTL